MTVLKDPITGHEFRECDYALKPGCRPGARAVSQVTVRYHELEADVLDLCAACARFVSRDARAHRYKVTVRALDAASRDLSRRQPK